MKKTRSLISTIALTLLAGIAFAGLVQPASVEVDLDTMNAYGDQLTARTSAGDTELIGCGSRTFDDALGLTFLWGFCQAVDADGDGVTCFIYDNPNLIAAIQAVNDYAYISFGWRNDGFGGAECTRIGSSKQSFYLSDPTIKVKEK